MSHAQEIQAKIDALTEELATVTKDMLETKDDMERISHDIKTKIRQARSECKLVDGAWVDAANYALRQRSNRSGWLSRTIDSLNKQLRDQRGWLEHAMVLEKSRSYNARKATFDYQFRIEAAKMLTAEQFKLCASNALKTLEEMHKANQS